MERQEKQKLKIILTSSGGKLSRSDDGSCAGTSLHDGVLLHGNEWWFWWRCCWRWMSCITLLIFWQILVFYAICDWLTKAPLWWWLLLLPPCDGCAPSNNLDGGVKSSSDGDIHVSAFRPLEFLENLKWWKEKEKIKKKCGKTRKKTTTKNKFDVTWR